MDLPESPSFRISGRGTTFCRRALLVLAALVAATLLAAGPATAEITLEETSNVAHYPGYWGEAVEHHTPDGEDRALVVTMAWNASEGGTIDSMTYGDESVHCEDPASNGDASVTTCVLADPPTGTHTLDVDYSNYVQEELIAVQSYEGVDTDDPIADRHPFTGHGTDAKTNLQADASVNVLTGGAAFDDEGCQDPELYPVVDDVVEDLEAQTGDGTTSCLSQTVGRASAPGDGDSPFGWESGGGPTDWAAYAVELRAAVVPVSFAANASSGPEGTDATIEVTLAEPAGESLTVDYESGGGTATLGEDYGLDAGTLTFEAGETTATIPVAVHDDDVDEAAETLGIDLVNPGPGVSTVSPSGHSFTIGDDDQGGGDSQDQNEAPSASADEGKTTSDKHEWVPVLSNDDDPDGDSLEVKEVDAPDGGTVSVASNDTILYDPYDDFSGEDTFRYTVEDASGATDRATVTVTVESPEEEGDPNGGGGGNEEGDGGGGEVTDGTPDPSSPSDPAVGGGPTDGDDDGTSNGDDPTGEASTEPEGPTRETAADAPVNAPRELSTSLDGAAAHLEMTRQDEPGSDAMALDLVPGSARTALSYDRDADGTHDLVLDVGIEALVEFQDRNGDGAYDPAKDLAARRILAEDLGWSLQAQGVRLDDGVAAQRIRAEAPLEEGSLAVVATVPSEAAAVDGTTVTPRDAKVTYEITGFPYADEGSSLALVLDVSATGADAIERRPLDGGPAVHADGGGASGYYAWAPSARVDGDRSAVQAHLGAGDGEDARTLTLAYGRGDHILHDPVAGLTYDPEAGGGGLLQVPAPGAAGVLAALASGAVARLRRR